MLHSLKTVLSAQNALSILLLTQSLPVNAAFRNPRQHNGLAFMPKRQAVKATAAEVSSTKQPTASTTYTMITPSPGADPVAITQQYQEMTSYVPLITLCSMVLITERGALLHAQFRANATASPIFATAPASTLLPPQPFPGTGNSRVAPSYGVGSAYTNTTTTAAGAPRYANTTTTSSSSSVTPHISEGCATSFSSTRTTVCATTLSGLASKATVTACTQRLTFSSQYGYRISVPPGVGDVGTMPPESMPPVETLTTFYLAGWQELTAPGEVPATVTKKICSQASVVASDDPGASDAAAAAAATAAPNSAGAGAGTGEVCVDEMQAWQTQLVTTVSTTTSHVDISTTIYGPSKLLIETFEAEITESVTVISLSTRMVIEYSTEGVSTLMRALDDGQTAGASSETISAARPGIVAAPLTVTVHPVQGVSAATSAAPTSTSAETTASEVTTETETEPSTLVTKVVKGTSTSTFTSTIQLTTTVTSSRAA